MTITTERSDPPPPHGKRSGFTLVEVLIAMVLGTMILAVAASVTGGLAKGSQSLINYSEMNTQSRQALSNLGSLLRSGSTVLEASDDQLRFIRLTESGDPETLTYSYDNARKVLLLTRSDGSVTEVLRDVSHLSFNYFTYRQNSTEEPLEIKHVQLEAEMTRRVLGLANRNYVISARFMLRNKRVNDGNLPPPPSS